MVEQPLASNSKKWERDITATARLCFDDVAKVRSRAGKQDVRG
jgi:hypothetical protein